MLVVLSKYKICPPAGPLGFSVGEQAPLMSLRRYISTKGKESLMRSYLVWRGRDLLVSRGLNANACRAWQVTFMNEASGCRQQWQD